MKTKYKILIASILVLSMLTAFAVTSFAYTTTDITYNGNTYSYNSAVSGNTHILQIWDIESIYLYYYDSGDNLVDLTINDDYVIIQIDDGGLGIAGLKVYNSSGSVFSESFSTNVNIVIQGNYKYALSTSTTFNNSLTNINNSTYLDYDVWNDSWLPDLSQINLLNNNEPNPLDKVNDFLTYLSTSLNKLTTMIVTNQILILFIVAVPVVSFVIGSFKRIKDAGRV